MDPAIRFDTQEEIMPLYAAIKAGVLGFHIVTPTSVIP